MSRVLAQKLEKWREREAKCLLYDSIMSGAVPASMMAANDVYNMLPQYQKFDFHNFKTNLNNLRDAILSKDYTRMQEDYESYGSDCAVLQGMQRVIPQHILWHESKAKKLLEHDIDEGIHMHLKPSMIHATRAEYKMFPLDVFRNHIYQEVDNWCSKHATCMAKKKIINRG